MRQEAVTELTAEDVTDPLRESTSVRAVRPLRRSRRDASSVLEPARGRLVKKRLKGAPKRLTEHH
ncbi:hypothetical protein [Streptomonospora litoralis]|uniref:hypothetical protein n=1 Tax=Streptomonospora litoralis TaxID=2498135 RepID=UPI001035A1AF|nr:hypothetical protein [Streptomonospora litoralis]